MKNNSREQGKTAKTRTSLAPIFSSSFEEQINLKLDLLLLRQELYYGHYTLQYVRKCDKCKSLIKEIIKVRGRLNATRQ